MPRSIEDEVSALNQQVAALQRSGAIAEGCRLADKAFFLAREELSKGSFALAQSARNRAIMVTMAGDQQEGVKTFVVALDLYCAALKQARSERTRIEQSGRFREARDAAGTQLRIAHAVVQLGQQFGKNFLAEVAESAIALAALDLEIGDPTMRRAPRLRRNRPSGRAARMTGRLQSCFSRSRGGSHVSKRGSRTRKAMPGRRCACCLRSARLNW